MKGFDPRYIKGIFIDLDDTLYEYAPCNDAAIHESLRFLRERLHRPLDEVAQAFEHGRTHTKLRLKGRDFELASSHSRLLYFQKAIERLMNHTDPQLTLEAEKIFWDAFRRQMRLANGAREFLQRAKAHLLRIAVITDMTAGAQLEKIHRLGIGDYVDFVVSSEESGRDKPHPDSLELALEKTQLTREEVVMVGEDEVRDIAAARSLGIVPIAIKIAPKNRETLFVKSFQELSELLRL